MRIVVRVWGSRKGRNMELRRIPWSTMGTASHSTPQVLCSTGVVVIAVQIMVTIEGKALKVRRERGVMSCTCMMSLRIRRYT